MTTSISPIPTDIQVLQKSHHVVISFSDGLQVTLPCDYLRINSPAADNKGHGAVAKTPVLTTLEKTVNIIDVSPVGNYAIKFVFDDGHKTGLFTWNYLYQLAHYYQQHAGTT